MAGPIFSPDGTKIAFVAGGAGTVQQIFVEDLATGVLVRVSADAQGAPANGASDFLSGFSPDGTKFAFSSSASNLVAGDVNGADIFIKDLATGAITLLSSAANGVAGNGASFGLHFSSDWGKVAFDSFSTNLGPADVDGNVDSFVKDLTTGVVTMVDRDALGVQGNQLSSDAIVSPDGTKVLFLSASTNLVAGGTDGTWHVFAKTLATGAVALVSSDQNGAAGNDYSNGFKLSPDGQKAAFFSIASNLVAGDSNGGFDLFIKDLGSGAIVRVPSAYSLLATNDFSFSPDGSKLVFESAADGLVAGDHNGAADIFIQDLATQAITLVSSDANGVVGSEFSRRPIFSPDGTKVAFESSARNLVPNDTNAAVDIFVKDLASGAVALISRSAIGATIGGYKPIFSPDGNQIAFLGSDPATAGSRILVKDISYLSDGRLLSNHAPVFAYAAPLNAVSIAAPSASAVAALSDPDGDGFSFDPRGSSLDSSGLQVRRGLYGSLTLDASNGQLSYALDAERPAMRQLSVGETATDSFVLTGFDVMGAVTTQAVDIAIEGAAFLTGLSINDRLVDRPGNTIIDGGAGLDSVSYLGLKRAYAVQATTGGVVTVDGQGGIDGLTNVERVQFADGYLAFGATDAAGQVYRLYQATLGRAPDAVGLANWVKAIDGGGLTLRSIAVGFTGSPEFLDRYGALDDTSFVSLLYANLLHRAPDAAGLGDWKAALATGHDRSEVVVGFSESAENIAASKTDIGQGLWVEDPAAAQVARLYGTVFARLPDSAGMINWTAALHGGAALAQVAAGFVGSPEFQSRYGALSNTDFVALLYDNVLHRPADTPGLTHWVDALAHGATRSDVVVGFSESPEHIAQLAPFIDDGVWF